MNKQVNFPINEIPQLTATGVEMVRVPVEQYNHIKLTEQEAKAAISQYHYQLSTDETAEVLRQARERKFYDRKVWEYMNKVNQIRMVRS